MPKSRFSTIMPVLILESREGAKSFNLIISPNLCIQLKMMFCLVQMHQDGDYYLIAISEGQAGNFLISGSGTVFCLDSPELFRRFDAIFLPQSCIKIFPGKRSLRPLG